MYCKILQRILFECKITEDFERVRTKQTKNSLGILTYVNEQADVQPHTVKLGEPSVWAGLGWMELLRLRLPAEADLLDGKKGRLTAHPDSASCLGYCEKGNSTFQGCIRINKIPKRPWGINYYCHPKREIYKNKLSFLTPGWNRLPSDMWKWAWNGIWVTHTSPWPVPNLTNLGNILSFSLLALLYWNIYSSNVFWCLWVLKTFTILQASPGWMNKNGTQFSLSAEELFQ